MKRMIRALCLFLIASAASLLAAEDKAPAAAASSDACACCKAKKNDTAEHPLKGVVIDVRSEKGSVLVKHEEIPGVMKAMTMLLRASEADLARLHKGDSIEAKLLQKDGTWWIKDIQNNKVSAQ